MASSQGLILVKINYILIFTAERINNLLKYQFHTAERLIVLIITHYQFHIAERLIVLIIIQYQFSHN